MPSSEAMIRTFRNPEGTAQSATVANPAFICFIDSIWVFYFLLLPHLTVIGLLLNQPKTIDGVDSKPIISLMQIELLGWKLSHVAFRKLSQR